MRNIILFILILLSHAAFAVEPPDGWRVSTEKELAAEPLRNKSPTKNAEVVGDLNGDGKIDGAYLFKSTKYSGEGLVVSLSSPRGYVWKVLDENKMRKDYPDVDLEMGIDLAEPGNYETACAKGYWECAPNEPKMLVLKLPGIWYYSFGSAASIWYWEKSSGEFKQVWISD